MEKRSVKNNAVVSLISRAFNAFIKYDFASLAAELTFYLITTFFPLIILIFIIISHTPIMGEGVIWNILKMLPDETADVIYSMLKSLAHTNAIIITVVVLSMWSMSGTMSVIAKALNRFYRVHEDRNILVVRIIGMLFAVLIVISVLVSFVFLVYGSLIGRAIMKYFPIHINLWNQARLAIPIVVITLVFVCVYKIMPNRRLSFKSVLPGAIFAATCWGLLSTIFSYYANNFARYHVIYGSIAGVIMLVTWLFMSSYVILFGGALNASLHRFVTRKRIEREGKNEDIS